MADNMILPRVQAQANASKKRKTQYSGSDYGTSVTGMTRAPYGGSIVPSNSKLISFIPEDIREQSESYLVNNVTIGKSNDFYVGQQAKQPEYKQKGFNTQYEYDTYNRLSNTTPGFQWWSGSNGPTLAEQIARATTLYGNDNYALQTELAGISAESSKSGTSSYDYYRASTNSDLYGYLNYYGLNVDHDLSHDELVSLYNEYRPYGKVSATSGKLTSGGKGNKKANIAYYLEKLLDDEPKTQKAEAEWAGLQKELRYWAGDRGLDYDEIMAKIDWKKYPTLKGMDDAVAETNTPTRFNRGIGYSKDNVTGVIWAARNGVEGNDYLSYAVAHYMGKGKQGVSSPADRAKRDPVSKDYHPFSDGCSDDSLRMLYGVDSFDQDTINEITSRQDLTPEQVAGLPALRKAEETTVAAEEQLGRLTTVLNNMDFSDIRYRPAEGQSVREWAQSMVDYQLEHGYKDIITGDTYNYSALKKMDDSRQRGNTPIALTRTVDYRREDVVQGLVDRYETYQRETEATAQEEGATAPQKPWYQNAIDAVGKFFGGGDQKQSADEIRRIADSGLPITQEQQAVLDEADKAQNSQVDPTWDASIVKSLPETVEASAESTAVDQGTAPKEESKAPKIAIDKGEGFTQGNVPENIDDRPQVELVGKDLEAAKLWDPEAEEGSVATHLAQAVSNKAGDVSVAFTPIDEEGTIASDVDGTFAYIEGLIEQYGNDPKALVEHDDRGLVMAVYTGPDAVQRSDNYGRDLHEQSAAALNGEDEYEEEPQQQALIFGEPIIERVGDASTSDSVSYADSTPSGEEAAVPAATETKSTDNAIYTYTGEYDFAFSMHGGYSYDTIEPLLYKMYSGQEITDPSDQEQMRNFIKDWGFLVLGTQNIYPDDPNGTMRVYLSAKEKFGQEAYDIAVRLEGDDVTNTERAKAISTIVMYSQMADQQGLTLPDYIDENPDAQKALQNVITDIDSASAERSAAADAQASAERERVIDNAVGVLGKYLQGAPLTDDENAFVGSLKAGNISQLRANDAHFASIANQADGMASDARAQVAMNRGRAPAGLNISGDDYIARESGVRDIVLQNYAMYGNIAAAYGMTTEELFSQYPKLEPDLPTMWKIAQKQYDAGWSFENVPAEFVPNLTVMETLGLTGSTVGNTMVSDTIGFGSALVDYGTTGTVNRNANNYLNKYGSQAWLMAEQDYTSYINAMPDGDQKTAYLTMLDQCKTGDLSIFDIPLNTTYETLESYRKPFLDNISANNDIVAERGTDALKGMYNVGVSVGTTASRIAEVSALTALGGGGAAAAFAASAITYGTSSYVSTNDRLKAAGVDNYKDRSGASLLVGIGTTAISSPYLTKYISSGGIQKGLLGWAMKSNVGGMQSVNSLGYSALMKATEFADEAARVSRAILPQQLWAGTAARSIIDSSVVRGVQSVASNVFEEGVMSGATGNYSYIEAATTPENMLNVFGQSAVSAAAMGTLSQAARYASNRYAISSYWRNAYKADPRSGGAIIDPTAEQARTSSRRAGFEAYMWSQGRGTQTEQTSNKYPTAPDYELPVRAQDEYIEPTVDDTGAAATELTTQNSTQAVSAATQTAAPLSPIEQIAVAQATEWVDQQIAQAEAAVAAEKTTAIANAPVITPTAQTAPASTESPIFGEPIIEKVADAPVITPTAQTSQAPTEAPIFGEPIIEKVADAPAAEVPVAESPAEAPTEAETVQSDAEQHLAALKASKEDGSFLTNYADACDAVGDSLGQTAANILANSPEVQQEVADSQAAADVYTQIGAGALNTAQVDNKRFDVSDAEHELNTAEVTLTGLQQNLDGLVSSDMYTGAMERATITTADGQSTIIMTDELKPLLAAKLKLESDIKAAEVAVNNAQTKLDTARNEYNAARGSAFDTIQQTAIERAAAAVQTAVAPVKERQNAIRKADRGIDSAMDTAISDAFGGKAAVNAVNEIAQQALDLVGATLSKKEARRGMKQAVLAFARDAALGTNNSQQAIHDLAERIYEYRGSTPMDDGAKLDALKTFGTIEIGPKLNKYLKSDLNMTLTDLRKLLKPASIGVVYVKSGQGNLDTAFAEWAENSHSGVSADSMANQQDILSWLVNEVGKATERSDVGLEAAVGTSNSQEIINRIADDITDMIAEKVLPMLDHQAILPNGSKRQSLLDSEAGIQSAMDNYDAVKSGKPQQTQEQNTDTNAQQQTEHQTQQTQEQTDQWSNLTTPTSVEDVNNLPTGTLIVGGSVDNGNAWLDVQKDANGNTIFIDHETGEQSDFTAEEVFDMLGSGMADVSRPNGDVVLGYDMDTEEPDAGESAPSGDTAAQGGVTDIVETGNVDDARPMPQIVAPPEYTMSDGPELKSHSSAFINDTIEKYGHSDPKVLEELKSRYGMVWSETNDSIRERVFDEVAAKGYDVATSEYLASDPPASKFRETQAAFRLLYAIAGDNKDFSMQLRLADHEKELRSIWGLVGDEMHAPLLGSSNSVTNDTMNASIEAGKKHDTYIKRHPRIAAAVKTTAANTQDAVSNMSDEATSTTAKYGVSISERQQALIDRYKLGKVKRVMPGMYHQAKKSQRMLELILTSSESDFQLTGKDSVYYQLECIRNGIPVLTTADILHMTNYAQEAQQYEVLAQNLQNVSPNNEKAYKQLLDAARVSRSKEFSTFANIDPADNGDKFTAYRYMALLGNGVTAIKTLSSTELFALAQNVSESIAVATDAAIAGSVDWANKKGLTQKKGVRTIAKLTPEQRKEVRSTLWHERGVVATDLAWGTDRTATNFVNTSLDTATRVRTFEHNALDYASRLSRALTTMSSSPRFAATYKASLLRQMNAANINRKKDGEDPLTEPTDIMRMVAQQDALKSVFMDRKTTTVDEAGNIIEKGTVTDTVGKILSDAKNSDNTALKFAASIAVPFGIVPTNVVKIPFQYSPFGAAFAFASAANEYKKSGGKFDQKKFVERIGEAAVGSAGILLGTMLAQLGLIKVGTGEKDKELSGVETAKGAQYSTYISIPSLGVNLGVSALSPAMSPLAMGAVLYDSISGDGLSPDTVMHMTTEMVASVAQSSMFTGLQNVGQAFEDSGAGGAMVALGSTFVSQMIPTVVRQAAVAGDPYIRDTSSDIYALQAINEGLFQYIPGLREMLPYKVDITGKPRMSKEGAQAFFNIFYTTRDNSNDPVLNEIESVYASVGKPGFIPALPLNGNRYKYTMSGRDPYTGEAIKEVVTLTPHERQEMNEEYGELWYQGFTELINSSEYRYMTDEEKYKAMNNIENEATKSVKAKWFSLKRKR